MKVGILTSATSPRGGGIYEVVCRGTRELYSRCMPQVEVFGIEDGQGHEYLDSWKPVPARLFSVKGLPSFGYAPALGSALNSAGLDVLHVHGLWMYSSIASRRWAMNKSKPYVITPHGMLDVWALHNSYWKKFIAAAFYEKAHLNGAACIHAVSRPELQAIRAYGLRNPVCVIPLGIDVPEKSAQANVVGTAEKNLLFLGRLHPKKGLVNLLHAWRDVQRARGKHRFNWRLFIAGWDQAGHGEELKALCRQLDCESTVHFVGPKFGPDKDALLRSANAFILPSVSEGLPMSLLEASAYGLPLVMTPQCNFPEALHAGAAIGISPDVDGIVSGLNRLQEMTDHERHSMGLRGRSLVETHFAWPVIALHLSSVYSWVVGGGNKPECLVLE
jgi:glycosyltransferase involved in cell wall biosynthesis